MRTGRPSAEAAGGGSTAPRPGVLVLSLALVALLTLTPVGTGWAWGSPAEELRWYVTGLDSAATLVQLLGNLALLAVPAGLAVARWPALARAPRLTGAAAAAAAGIELLQWALPLGRVVSPLDAVLNVLGAVAAGLLVARARRRRCRASTVRRAPAVAWRPPPRSRADRVPGGRGTAAPARWRTAQPLARRERRMRRGRRSPRLRAGRRMTADRATSARPRVAGRRVSRCPGRP